MLSDTGEVNLHVDARSLQDVCWPDTAVHQDTRAAHRTAREDHLLADLDRLPRAVCGGGPLDTGSGQIARVRGVEEQPGDGRVRENCEVVARRERVDVPSAGVGTRPVGRVDRVGRNVRAERIAAIRVLAYRDPSVGQGSSPGADG